MTSERELAIPRGSLVLVTGANGYIGAHVCHQLLLQGYRVRGASRKLAKIQYLKEKFQKEFGTDSFDAFEVPDFGSPGAYKEAMAGCAGVVHVATNLAITADVDKVVSSVVEGDLNIVRTAAETPSVKRFVLTSSSKTAYWPQPVGAKVHLDGQSWNDKSGKEAYTLADNDPLKPLQVYSASKIAGEKALWKFMENEKPAFVFNVVLPDLNFGEVLDRSPTRNESTGGYINSVYKGDLSTMVWFSQVPSWFVDVSDTARIHVAALIEADVANERVWAATEAFHVNHILAILRKLYPEKEFAEDVEGLGYDLTTIDNSRGTALLKRQGRDGWISQKESIWLNTKDIDSYPPLN